MKLPQTALLATCLALLQGHVYAEAPKTLPQPIKLDIASQPLGDALNQFAQQAGLQLVYHSRVAKGLQAPRIVGSFIPKNALEQLLEKTGLRYEYLDADTVAIFSSKQKPAANSNSEVPTTGVEVRNTSQDWLLAVAKDDPVAVDAGTDGSQREKSKKSDKSSAVEEMIVEDTKIKPFSDANADLPRTINDHQPYYIFDSKEIERSGALTVQDFLRQRLTMDTTFQTNSELYVAGLPGVPDGLGRSLGGEGIPGTTMSSFNLRGLGAAKTLVLVNGRRVAGVSYSRGSDVPRETQADLNGIPLSAIDRIEVLPSSASAIYGGDAIGGVINVVLKNKYKGGDLRATYDTPSNSSASTITASATYGFSFEGGKSQLMLSANYLKSDPMLLGDRRQYVQSGLDYLNRLYVDAYKTGYGTAGDGVSNLYNAQLSMGPTGTFLTWYGNEDLVLKDGTVIVHPQTPGLWAAYVKPGTTSATPMAERFLPLGPEYFAPSPGYGTFGLKQPMGSNADNKSISLSYTRQMTASIDAFAEFRGNKNTSGSYYAPLITARYAFAFDTPPSAIANPFGSSLSFIQFGTTLGDPSFVTSTSTNYSATAGVKAHFSSGWAGELSFTRSQNAFGHDFAPVDGNLVVNLARDAVIDLLVDPFSESVNLTPYYQTKPITTHSRFDEAAVRMAGPVFHLPWGDPALSLGLSRSTSSMPDSSLLEHVFGDLGRSGDVTTRMLPSLRQTLFYAHATTNDVAYFESTIPLFSEKNKFPLMRSLSLQAVQRFSRSVAETGTSSASIFYTTAGTVDRISYSPIPKDAVNGVGGTPIRRLESYASHDFTFGFKYEPLEDVAIRASIGSAFSPPTYAQLVPDQTFTSSGATISNDPLAPGVSYKANQTSGGNPNLLPQRAETRDIGIIYEPRINGLKGFRANLEYYEISQFDFIATPNITELLTIPEFASRVTRDPVTNRVTAVDVTLTNIAERSTSGADLSLSYLKPTTFGDWAFSLAGTKIFYERRQTRVSSPMLNYAGYPSAGGPIRYKGNANLVWSSKGITLGWNTTWYGNYRLNQTPGSPLGFDNRVSANWALQGSYSIPSQFFHNMFVGYDFGKNPSAKLLSDIGVQLNVQNVFNTVPHFDVSVPPFYMSPVGSFRLRAYTLSVKKAF